MKRIFFFIFFLINFYEVFCQEIPISIPPSPVTQQFQRYGDYPVSYFTGIPDISIPIYTIKDGDIEIPITLTYHSGGTRPEDVAGYAGLGWILNTGGTISRTIRSLPDEYILEEFPDYVNMPQQQQLYTLHGDVENYCNNNWDHEFDLYSYNFNGHSGKFLLPYNDPNYNGYSEGRPFMLQLENLNILNPTTAIDANGIKYDFNGPSEEMKVNRGANNLLTAETAWYLGHISSGKYPNKFVNYTYQLGPEYQKYPFSCQFVLDDYCFGDETTTNFETFYPNYTPGNRICGSSVLIYKTYIPQRINFSTGYILINLTSGKLLSSIEVFDLNNNLIKRVHFNIGSFSTTNPSNTIAKLQSLAFEGVNGEPDQTYSFNYEQENVTDAVIFGSAGGQDHWGFYNGPDQDGGSRIFNFTNFFTLSHLDLLAGVYRNIGGVSSKLPSENFTKAYVLNKITYPTKGYTIFDYELNREYFSYQAVGGLRIKSIGNYSKDGTLAGQKNYTYQYGTYEVNPYDKYLYMYNGSVGSYLALVARRTFVTANSQVDLSPKGTPIGYPLVTESDGNFTTKYEYDYNPAYNYDHRMNYPGTSYTGEYNYKLYADEYKPWNYGNLLSKSVTGPGVQYSESNEYEEVILDTVRDVLIDRTIFMVQGSEADVIGADQFPYNVANRYHYSGGKRLKSKSITKDNVSLTTTYSYNNPAYPSQISSSTVTQSTGDVVEKKFKYAYDFPNISPYPDMVTKDQTGIVIETTEKNVTTNQEVSKTTANYDYFNPTSNSPGQIFIKDIQKSFRGGTQETQMTVNKYDDSGNIIQTTDKGGFNICYIYGYGSAYPIAKINNASYSDVELALGGSVAVRDFGNITNPSDQQVRDFLAPLRSSLSGAHMATYTYKPLVGITSATDASGRTTSYEYDGFQRLKNVKDQDGNIIKTNGYHYKP